MSGVVERILCVEDDLQVRRLITRLVSAAGYDCAGAGDAREARDLLDREPFSIVLCDIGLPGESGLELLREVSGRSPDVAMLMVTGRDEPEIAHVALELGAYGYLTKPFAENALRINLANALHRRRLEIERRSYEETLEATVALRTAELRESVSRLEASEAELRKAYCETVDRLGRAIEYHDGTTGAHVERVASYAAAIAHRLGIEPERAELLRLASPLHDVGKLAIGEHILAKPAALTRDERCEIEQHTEAGYRLLAGSGNELLDLAATIARSHHERWDGAGYPHRLAGEEIPLEGRIVAVADVFDALTSDRPYRPGLTSAEAREHIVAEAGTAFDPRVVSAFLELEL
ncbi:MAG TPA: HD domain-containing phosphohydrolase [Gaiellaceae bacterium]|nr:HD domain-containing phosphohydrolase [Gaiellaceae bacterium]